MGASVNRRSLLFGTAALAASGCGHASGKNGGPAPIRLAMVTDIGGLGDKSFNDSAYRGLLEAKDRLGAEIEVLQSRSAADYQPNLTVLADEEYNEIFAIGFLMSEDLAQVANAYPRRNFAIVDAVVDRPNVASITFKEQDGSFLAGALAAMMTKTKTIAFLGGLDIPLLRKFEAGYTAGAHQIDPHVNVLVKYIGSFDDVASGKELAGVLYDQHADIVFAAAGKSGLGAFDAVRDRPGAYVIGCDSDQDAIAPGKVLTSMIKHVDVAVFRVAQETRSEKLPAGITTLGIADGAIGLTDFAYTKDRIGPARIARLAALRSAIVSGAIVPPQTRDELAAFKPVAL
jgi:basic membrane protein A